MRTNAQQSVFSRYRILKRIKQSFFKEIRKTELTGWGMSDMYAICLRASHSFGYHENDVYLGRRDGTDKFGVIGKR